MTGPGKPLKPFPPGRPGEIIKSAPSPAIVLVALPLGALLGLGLRIVGAWLGWR